MAVDLLVVCDDWWRNKVVYHHAYYQMQMGIMSAKRWKISFELFKHNLLDNFVPLNAIHCISHF